MSMNIRAAVFISIFTYLATTVASAQTSSGVPLTVPTTKIPVLVELFTSEGCSTCPPADDLLALLKQKQPIEGVQLIALGFHVDYWDTKGWKDRFSSNVYTRRQEGYAKRLHDEVYTPQMVIDGDHLIQDGPTIPPIVTAAASVPKPVNVLLEQSAENAQLQIQGSAGNAEAFLAVVEDGLETLVKGGENQGKTLHHAAVVRDWHALGAASHISGKKTIPLNIPADADRSRLQLVAFVQDAASGRVLGLQAVQLR